MDASPVSVPRVRRLATEFAEAHGVPEPPLQDLKLAVSEAVTNAVLHAYVDTEPGPVTVVLEVADQDVEVVVRDRGPGLAPRQSSPGLDMGLTLIRQLATDVVLRKPSDGPGAEVWMRFNIAA